MNITALDDVKLLLGITSYDYDLELEYLRLAIESAVQRYCQKDFESTTYTNELYDGTGSEYLQLYKSPIISISRVSIDREEAIKIKNVATDATSATILVDDSGITLTVSGGSMTGTNTLAFATYTTLLSLVNQINTLSATRGWQAEVYDSDQNSYKTTNLMSQFLGCNDREWVYIQMAGESLDNIYMYKNDGIIKYEGGFPKGVQNIAVTYTAGYSLVPYDVKVAIINWIGAEWTKRQNDGLGLKRFDLGQLTMEFVQTEIPDFIKGLLTPHRVISV